MDVERESTATDGGITQNLGGSLDQFPRRTGMGWRRRIAQKKDEGGPESRRVSEQAKECGSQQQRWRSPFWARSTGLIQEEEFARTFWNVTAVILHSKDVTFDWKARFYGWENHAKGRQTDLNFYIFFSNLIYYDLYMTDCFW